MSSSLFFRQIWKIVWKNIPENALKLQKVRTLTKKSFQLNIIYISWVRRIRSIVSYYIEEEWNPSPEASVLSHERCFMSEPKSRSICKHTHTHQSHDQNSGKESFKSQTKRTCRKLIMMGWCLFLPVFPSSNLKIHTFYYKKLRLRKTKLRCQTIKYL